MSLSAGVPHPCASPPAQHLGTTDHDSVRHGRDSSALFDYLPCAFSVRRRRRCCFATLVRVQTMDIDGKPRQASPALEAAEETGARAQRGSCTSCKGLRIRNMQTAGLVRRSGVPSMCGRGDAVRCSGDPAANAGELRLWEPISAGANIEARDRDLPLSHRCRTNMMHCSVYYLLACLLYIITLSCLV